MSETAQIEWQTNQLGALMRIAVLGKVNPEKLVEDKEMVKWASFSEEPWPLTKPGLVNLIRDDLLEPLVRNKALEKEGEDYKISNKGKTIVEALKVTDNIKPWECFRVASSLFRNNRACFLEVLSALLDSR